MTQQDKQDSLAIPENQSLAQSGGSFSVEGMEGLDMDDVIVPRWDILQPTSRKEGTTGHFHHNLSGEVKEALDAVILRITKTRVLWSGATGDNTPECKSIDGVTGFDGKPCKGCEFNRFAEGNLKTCKGGYTYLCATVGNPEDLFILSMYSTSAKAGKMLNSQFLTKRRSPYTAVVRFATEQQIGDKGKYYVHKPTVVKWLKPEEFAPYQEMSRALQGAAIQEVDTSDAPHNNNGGGADSSPTDSEALWESLGPEPPKDNRIPASQQKAQAKAQRKDSMPF